MGDRANINRSYGGRQSGLDGEAIMSAMGGVQAGGAPTPTPVTWDSTVNLIFHGNSITDGTGATGGQSFPSQVKAQAPYKNSGATSTTLGRGGYTWAQLTADASAIDALFIPGKVNILVASETTNSVFNSPFRTTAQTIADAKAYVAGRMAANPWDRILLVGTIPREDIAGAGANTTSLNLVMNAVDADMKANISAYGAYGYIDIRTGTGYDFADYSVATFNNAQALYYETAVNGRVHPPNAGHAIFASKIAGYLQYMPIPVATPSLSQLSLSGTLVNGTASNGTITGAKTGEVITSNVSGLNVTSAARTYTWDGTGAVGTTNNGLVGTLAGATNSPRPSPISVVAAGATVDPLSGTSITYGTGKFGQGIATGKGFIPTTVWPQAPTLPMTIEVFASTTSTALIVLAGQQSAGNTGWYMGAANGKAQAACLSTDMVSTVTVNDGLFHHYALVLHSAGADFFVDGNKVGTTTTVFTNNSNTLPEHRNLYTFPWSGVTDEMVITPTRKYIANFTPPTAPFGTGFGGTVYHMDGDLTGNK